MNLNGDDVAPFRVAAQSVNRVKGDPVCQDQKDSVGTRYFENAPEPEPR
jgi:hypothetical protein